MSRVVAGASIARDLVQFDRSTGSRKRSRENSKLETEISTGIRSEQIRLREIGRKSAENSQPIARRRRRSAARAEVPEPRKGSRRRSPSEEEARRMRSRRARGFCVGCLPNFFSQGSGGGMVQTDFICLPAFICFMSL